MTVILISGPARSGKSRFAEILAEQSGRPVLYIATSPAPDPQADPEWYERIQRHRQRRPDSWETLEIPHELAVGIKRCQREQCCLVDSLGAWVANGLELEDDAWMGWVGDLIDGLQICEGLVIVVAEEVGWGVVPAYPMGRGFRDRLGELVQAVAAIADNLYLVTAGHVLDLKQLGVSLASLEPGVRAISS